MYNNKFYQILYVYHMLKEQFAIQCDTVTLKIAEESKAKSRKASPGTRERGGGGEREFALRRRL